MKKQSYAFMLFIAVCGLFLSGCTHHGEFKAVGEISTTADKTLAMQTAEKKLRQMNFTIDKFDIEDGYIRTKPLRAAGIFEFWRKDNVGGFNTAEANMHTIRRVVELNFSQLGGGTQIACQAKAYRLSIDESQAKAAASPRGPSLLEEADSLEKLRLPAGEQSWIELGNDERLATAILNKINGSLAKK